MVSKQIKINILWAACILFLLSIALIFTLTAMDFFGELPSIKELQNPSSSMSSEIYSEDGVLLGKYYQRDRLTTRYKDISPFVYQALLATEDERFFSHSGVDLRSVGRAVFGVLTLKLKGGASTISQQLALNLLVEMGELDKRASNKFRRTLQKLKEWVIAVKLERNFTKEEILALYLNTVPFGDNIYGIRNASKTFFQKEPIDLKLEEAAVLIGMLKGNTLYNPRKNPKQAIERRNVVIDQMYGNDFLNYAQATEAKQKPMLIRYLRLDEQAGLATYLREVVREDVKKLIKDVRKPNGAPYDIYKDGLKIYTTINSVAQRAAEDAADAQLAKLQKIMDHQAFIKSGSIWQSKMDILWNIAKTTKRWQSLAEEAYSEAEIKKVFQKKVRMRVFAWNKVHEKDTVMTPLDSIKYHQQILQVGFLAMDPNTGFVKAWVGGADYKYFKYDHVNIGTRRQVGSAIKPLLYALAVMELGYTPTTMCPNVEVCFPEYDNWCSHNNDKTISDNVTLSRGLSSSLNNVSAYLIKRLTPRRFVEFLRAANIQSTLLYVPSICLGTPDISLFEMVWAYSMFPAHGYSVKPVYITRVDDKNGNTLKTFTTTKNYVISDVDAYTTTQMLKNAVDFGTAASVRYRYQVKGEMAGKTGTTNDNADAWFMGFTPNLITGTWVGCDLRFLSITSDAGYGGVAALPIFANFMNGIAGKSVSLDTTLQHFVMPVNYYQKLHAGRPDADTSATQVPNTQPKKDTPKNNLPKNIYIN